MSDELLPCPFCGHRPPDDLIDTLYPSGTYWREADGLRQYIGHRERRETDSPCWTMHCKVSDCGCGAQITADRRDGVIAKWNTRALSTQPAAPLPAVPDGWQLVPIDATIEMITAAIATGQKNSKAGYWAAMLAAAPSHLAACAGDLVQRPLTVQEVEQILAQHDYELHGDRARYIVRMTEEAHGIVEPARGDVPATGQIKKAVSGITEGGDHV